MTEAQKIIQLEGKLKALEEQVDILKKHVGLAPNEKMLQSAVEQIILNRDVKKLEEYIRLGGPLNYSKEAQASL